MIKINDSEGKLFGVFHDEKEVYGYLLENCTEDMEVQEYMVWINLPFKETVEMVNLHITEDTVNCQVCHNELDEDFDDELLIGYRCSYCRENPEMGKYPV